MKKIMIMSGEASGDLHGANLAREIWKQDPAIAIYGVGSKQMQRAGVRMLADAKEISVVGITEVLTHLGGIYRVYAHLKRFLKHERPDLLVLIDFPDFNIMLGKAAQRLGIPVLYYISPQVWVWRKGRIKTIARLVKAMIVVFPFEVTLYEKAGVDVRFVGHPLTDVVRSDLTKEQAKSAFDLDASRRTIALLPGSRKSELTHLLPDMLAAAKILSTRFQDLQFILPVAPTLEHELRSHICGTVRSLRSSGRGEGVRCAASIGCSHRHVRYGHARNRSYGNTDGDRLSYIGNNILHRQQAGACRVEACRPREYRSG